MLHASGNCLFSRRSRALTDSVLLQIFIASDPRVEAARAALQHCEWDAELDRKLHVVRNTFRCGHAAIAGALAGTISGAL